MSARKSKSLTKNSLASTPEFTHVSLTAVSPKRFGLSAKVKKVALKTNQDLIEDASFIKSASPSKKKYIFAALAPKYTIDLPNSYQAMEGIKKAEEELKTLGVSVEKFSFDDGNQKSFLAQIKKVIAKNYDGIIFPPLFTNETEHLLKHCNSKKIPYIFYDGNMNEAKALAYIGQDDFKSGYLAGKLAAYLLQPNESALCVCIHTGENPPLYTKSKLREDGFQKILEDEMGFKLYSFEHFISEGDETKPLEKKILQELTYHPDIKIIFATNSEVHKIAAIIEKIKIKGLKIIGYDLIDKNIDYLKKEIIHFLISQEPYQQGYLSVINLFNHLALNRKIEKENFVPITIVMKENIDYCRAR